ncbi:hypothetical protein BU16DRAFT_554129 [Lophium mytilinum]|uniref:Uncharacterized protein n=1 Tax=Lophium mytilinum TaxID=390894 RepID=A0A6A6RBX0_9PEZI|nr:hypothetical protein BU16DRAFT_554129 [Lophium mytilinum]
MVAPPPRRVHTATLRPPLPSGTKKRVRAALARLDAAGTSITRTADGDTEDGEATTPSKERSKKKRSKNPETTLRHIPHLPNELWSKIFNMGNDIDTDLSISIWWDTVELEPRLALSGSKELLQRRLLSRALGPEAFRAFVTPRTLYSDAPDGIRWFLSTYCKGSNTPGPKELVVKRIHTTYRKKFPILEEMNEDWEELWLGILKANPHSIKVRPKYRDAEAFFLKSASDVDRAFKGGRADPPKDIFRLKHNGEYVIQYDLDVESVLAHSDGGIIVLDAQGNDLELRMNDPAIRPHIATHITALHDRFEYHRAQYILNQPQRYEPKEHDGIDDVPTEFIYEYSDDSAFEDSEDEEDEEDEEF